jgi:ABC-type antimicrobial peptide transport system permease subunit
MALGASRRQISRAVLRESLTWASAGIVIGGVIFFPIATRLSGALYGVTPHDPQSWIAAVVALLAVVTIASWIPAFRAGRTDPASLMRNL